MLIEKTEVFGFHAAMRAMRNPKNSWHLSDSRYGFRDDDVYRGEVPHLGPNDMDLATRLIKAGTEHRKFLRQIVIWVDVTLPRYIWQELDTYKVSTVRNSCSTMHKLTSRLLEQSDFEDPIPVEWINQINDAILLTRTKEKTLDELKGLLPEGFLQKATYTMNYETAMTMFKQRRNHRLPQWKEGAPGSICEWIKSLPYMAEWLEAALPFG